MIRLVQQASVFAARSPAPATSAGTAQRVLVLRRSEDDAALAGAAVTVDGTVTRTADSGGQVEFPASLLAPGQHVLSILGLDGRTLSLTVTVGASGEFAQTVHVGAPASPPAAAEAPSHPPLVIAGDMPDGHIGDRVSVVYAVTGGAAPYSITLASGELPAGMGAITSAGLCTGKYASEGDYAFTVQATDAAGATASVTDAVHVSPAGDWLDITGSTYWTSSNSGLPGQAGPDYEYTNDAWVLNPAWDNPHQNGNGKNAFLSPTAAAISAAATATKLRITGRISYPAQSGQLAFGYLDDGQNYSDGTNEQMEGIPVGTSYGPLTSQSFFPLAPSGMGSEVGMGYALFSEYFTSLFDITKIEVYVP